MSKGLADKLLAARAKFAKRDVSRSGAPKTAVAIGVIKHRAKQRT